MRRFDRSMIAVDRILEFFMARGEYIGGTCLEVDGAKLINC